MKKMPVLAAVFAAVLFVAVPQRSSAQDDGYRETLSEMLDSSNALSAAEVVMDQLLPVLRQLAPGVPADYWDRLAAKWTSDELRNRLIDAYVPIYRKHFTRKELRKITAFYRTSVGRKLAQATPDMTVEGLEAGQQLGWEIVREVQRDLQELGCE